MPEFKLSLYNVVGLSADENESEFHEHCECLRYRMQNVDRRWPPEAEALPP